MYPSSYYLFFFLPFLPLPLIFYCLTEASPLKSGPHLDLAPKLFLIEVNNDIMVRKHNQIVLCVYVCALTNTVHTHNTHSAAKVGHWLLSA